MCLLFVFVSGLVVLVEDVDAGTVMNAVDKVVDIIITRIMTVTDD